MRAGEKSSSSKPAASQQTNGVAPGKADKGGKGKKADTRPVDLSLLDLRVGIINKAERHPDAETLYVEEVDCGEPEPRTVSISCDFLLFFHFSDFSVWQLYFACVLRQEDRSCPTSPRTHVCIVWIVAAHGYLIGAVCAGG